jgi:hypothetical protein
MTVTVTSEAEFPTAFDAAATLWERRLWLLPRCDIIDDWRRQLGEVEARYREHVAVLAPLCERYAVSFEGILAHTRDVGVQVAVHLALASRSEAYLSWALEVARREDDPKGVAVCRMLRFCDLNTVESVGQSLLALECPWALCLLGRVEGFQIYERAFQAEKGDPEDIALFYALFCGIDDFREFERKLVETRDPAWRAGCLVGLGALGTTLAVPLLLESLAAGDDESHHAANRALVDMFGVQPDYDPGDLPGENQKWWHAWWQANSVHYDPRIRYAKGEPYSLEREFQRMEHPIWEEREGPFARTGG